MNSKEVIIHCDSNFRILTQGETLRRIDVSVLISITASRYVKLGRLGAKKNWWNTIPHFLWILISSCYMQNVRPARKNSNGTNSERNFILRIQFDTGDISISLQHAHTWWLCQWTATGLMYSKSSALVQIQGLKPSPWKRKPPMVHIPIPSTISWVSNINIVIVTKRPLVLVRN